MTVSRASEAVPSSAKPMRPRSREPEIFDTMVSFIMLHHTVAWEAVLAESARVLRPGGRLVGYDLLSTVPARLLHRLEGQPYLRIVTMNEFRRTMSVLPFEHVVLRKCLAGLAVQFSARRALRAADESRDPSVRGVDAVT